jgi:hypothetical protein
MSATITSLAVNSSLINFASGRVPENGSPLTDFYLVSHRSALPFWALFRHLFNVSHPPA